MFLHDITSGLSKGSHEIVYGKPRRRFGACRVVCKQVTVVLGRALPHVLEDVTHGGVHFLTWCSWKARHEGSSEGLDTQSLTLFAHETCSTLSIDSGDCYWHHLAHAILNLTCAARLHEVLETGVLGDGFTCLIKEQLNYLVDDVML